MRRRTTTLNPLLEGYGLAAANSHRKHEIQKALRRLKISPDTIYMAHWVYYPCDDPTGQFPDYRGGEEIKEITVYELLVVIGEGVEDYYGNFSLDCVQNLNDLINAYYDTVESDDGCCRAIMTPEESRKFVLEEKRKKLEHHASDFAKSHNCTVSSVEFIEAIQEELGRVNSEREAWNNPETRMEEWAACRYNGLGTDVYFDDLNFENGRYASRSQYLYEILDWLREACPLLMAKYDEQLLEQGTV